MPFALRRPWRRPAASGPAAPTASTAPTPAPATRTGGPDAAPGSAAADRPVAATVSAGGVRWAAAAAAVLGSGARSGARSGAAPATTTSLARRHRVSMPPLRPASAMAAAAAATAAAAASPAADADALAQAAAATQDRYDATKPHRFHRSRSRPGGLASASSHASRRTPPRTDRPGRRPRRAHAAAAAARPATRHSPALHPLMASMIVLPDAQERVYGAPGAPSGIGFPPPRVGGRATSSDGTDDADTTDDTDADTETSSEADAAVVDAHRRAQHRARGGRGGHAGMDGGWAAMDGWDGVQTAVWLQAAGGDPLADDGLSLAMTQRLHAAIGEFVRLEDLRERLDGETARRERHTNAVLLEATRAELSGLEHELAYLASRTPSSPAAGSTMAPAPAPAPTPPTEAAPAADAALSRLSRTLSRMQRRPTRPAAAVALSTTAAPTATETATGTSAAAADRPRAGVRGLRRLLAATRRRPWWSSSDAPSDAARPAQLEALHATCRQRRAVLERLERDAQRLAAQIRQADHVEALQWTLYDRVFDGAAADFPFEDLLKRQWTALMARQRALGRRLRHLHHSRADLDRALALVRAAAAAPAKPRFRRPSALARDDWRHVAALYRQAAARCRLAPWPSHWPAPAPSMAPAAPLNAPWATTVSASASASAAEASSVASAASGAPPLPRTATGLIAFLMQERTHLVFNQTHLERYEAPPMACAVEAAKESLRSERCRIMKAAVLSRERQLLRARSARLMLPRSATLAAPPPPSGSGHAATADVDPADAATVPRRWPPQTAAVVPATQPAPARLDAAHRGSESPQATLVDAETGSTDDATTASGGDPAAWGAPLNASDDPPPYAATARDPAKPPEGEDAAAETRSLARPRIAASRPPSFLSVASCSLSPGETTLCASTSANGLSPLSLDPLVYRTLLPAAALPEAADVDENSPLVFAWAMLRRQRPLSLQL